MSRFGPWSLAVVAAAVTLAFAATATADPATQTSSDVHPFGNPNVTLGGYSKLVRNDTGVAATMHVDGLTAGGAYTMWWVFFNNPAACTHPMLTSGGVKISSCSAADLGNAATGASVQYAAGHVVGGSGQATFGSYFTAGGTPQCAGPGIPCAGLADSRTAEVHLIVRSHGDAVPGFIPEQTQSFNGGCLAGEPNVGQCANVRMSIHNL